MSVAETSRKKNRGRQKIEMKKMTNESNFQVTFCKCRSGLFKKASELSTLCGAELALIIFSPSGKVFSFGHPSVEAIIQRYVSQVPHQTSGIMWYTDAQRSANVRELNAQLTHINNQLEAHKKHGEELSHLFKTAPAQFWWARPVEEMDRPQLEKYRETLNDLKMCVTSYGVATSNPPNHLFFAVAGGPTNVVVPVQHPPPQVFPQHIFHGPLLQAHHLFDFNNMGGYEGSPRFFLDYLL